MRYLSLFSIIAGVAILPSLGCTTDGGDCDFGLYDREASEASQYRNPHTGHCETIAGPPGPGPGCDDPCAPCFGAEDEIPEEPEPEWGSCDTECESLGEYDCWATPQCRAAYLDSDDEEQTDAFYDCWHIGSPPVTEASCEGLDATTCSLADYCVAIHQNACANQDSLEFPDCLGNFVRCEAEPETCFSTNECEDGMRCTAGVEHCYTVCPPDWGARCDAACAGYCVVP